MTFYRWAPRVLLALDIVPTTPRLAFLRAWQRCEGGTADNNPLNTTMRVDGSWNYNSAGVQNYPTPVSGLAATLLTLRLPAYAELRHALRARNLSARAIASLSAEAVRTWGTNPDCIRRRLS